VFPYSVTLQAYIQKRCNIKSFVLLFITVIPEIQSKEERIKRVIVGQPVNISCNATGDPRPRVIWQKGTTVLSDLHGLNYFLLVTSSQCEFSPPSDVYSQLQ